MWGSEAIDPDHGGAAVGELERGGGTHRAETDDDHVRRIGRAGCGRATAHGMSTIAELASGGERVIGLGRARQRIGRGDRNRQLSGREQGQHRALDGARRERLLLQRPGTERGAVDPGAFHHQHPQVELGLGAGSGPDHGDPAPDLQRRQVRRQIGALRPTRG